MRGRENNTTTIYRDFFKNQLPWWEDNIIHGPKNAIYFHENDAEDRQEEERNDKRGEDFLGNRLTNELLWATVTHGRGTYFSGKSGSGETARSSRVFRPSSLSGARENPPRQQASRAGCNVREGGQDSSIMSMDVKKAMQVLGSVGPRGGNTDNPALHPEARRKSLDVEKNLDGTLGLHRFERPDSAVNGKVNEQPWNRMAAYMLNVGRTNSEIAVAAGVSVDAVSQLRGNKWFQELCATIANSEGEEILGLLRSETAASVETLVKLRDRSESERIQLSAAQILLEQSHGKPIQKIVSNVSHTRYSSPEDEMKAIQDELDALRRTRSASPEIPSQDVK